MRPLVRGVWLPLAGGRRGSFAALCCALGLCQPLAAIAQQPQVEVREKTLAEQATAPDAERWLAVWGGQAGALDQTATEPVWLVRWQSALGNSWAQGRALPDKHPLALVTPSWLQVGKKPHASVVSRANGTWQDGLCPASAPRAARLLSHLTPIVADDVGRVALLLDLSCVHQKTLLRRARVRIEANASGVVRSAQGVVVDVPMPLADEPSGPLCTWPVAPRFDSPRRNATWLTGVPQRGWLAGWRVGPGAHGAVRCEAGGGLPRWQPDEDAAETWAVALWHGADGEPQDLLLTAQFADGRQWPQFDRPGHWALGPIGAEFDFAMLRGLDEAAERIAPVAFVLDGKGPPKPAPLPLPAAEGSGSWQCEPDAQSTQLVCHWLGESGSSLQGAEWRLQWRGGRFQPVRD